MSSLKYILSTKLCYIRAVVIEQGPQSPQRTYILYLLPVLNPESTPVGGNWEFCRVVCPRGGGSS